MSGNPQRLWGSCGGRGQVNKADGRRGEHVSMGMVPVVGGLQRGAGEEI